MLQSDKNTASYKTVATFSLAHWPFSLKLCWAPIVDSIYFKSFGRRKTWLVPTQYGLGIAMLILAHYVDDFLGREPGHAWGPLGVIHDVKIVELTIAFFMLTLLAATQDIAVDGWALTMLSKKRLGWASTCNSVGQSLGFVVAFLLFITLESPTITNQFFRSTPVEGQGLVSFSGFLTFWGVVFIITTTLVALFKHESGSCLAGSGCSPMTIAKQCRRRRSSSSKSSRTFLCTGCAKRSSGSDDYNSQACYHNQGVDDGWEQISDGTFVLKDINSDKSPRNRRESSSKRHHDNEFRVIVDNNDNASAASSTSISNHRREEEERYDLDEDEKEHDRSIELSLCQTYKTVFGILHLRPILLYIAFIFITKFAFSAPEAITTYRLIEGGFPKEHLALLGMLILPIQSILPLFITRLTNGPRPLKTYIIAFLPRLALASLVIPLIYYMPSFEIDTPSTSSSITPPMHTAGSNPSPSFGWSLYVLLLTYTAISALPTIIMFVSQMAFHARISDPSVGGTYMTLLNTAANLAGALPNTLQLYFVELLTSRQCLDVKLVDVGRIVANASSSSSTGPIAPSDANWIELGRQWMLVNGTCDREEVRKVCRAASGYCKTYIDGFYLQVGFCIAFGLAMFPLVIRPLARYLNSLSPSDFLYRLETPTCCHQCKLFVNCCGGAGSPSLKDKFSCCLCLSSSSSSSLVPDTPLLPGSPRSSTS